MRPRQAEEVARAGGEEGLAVAAVEVHDVELGEVAGGQRNALAVRREGRERTSQAKHLELAPRRAAPEFDVGHKESACRAVIEGPAGRPPRWTGSSDRSCPGSRPLAFAWLT